MPGKTDCDVSLGESSYIRRAPSHQNKLARNPLDPFATGVQLTSLSLYCENCGTRTMRDVIPMLAYSVANSSGRQRFQSWVRWSPRPRS